MLVNYYSEISGPPFWELLRGGGPITEWINDRKMFGRKKIKRKLGKKIEYLKFDLQNVKLNNHSTISNEQIKQKLAAAIVELVEFERSN